MITIIDFAVIWRSFRKKSLSGCITKKRSLIVAVLLFLLHSWTRLFIPIGPVDEGAPRKVNICNYDNVVSSANSDILKLHYVWIDNRRSRFPHDITTLQLLSIVSALNQLSPVIIYLHSNADFSGPLWDNVKDRIQVVKITVPYSLNGKPIMHVQHQADLVKLEAAYNTGGFFADFDIYFTGNRDKFMALFAQYECVFTPFKRDGRTLLAIGNFACKELSPFIQQILQEYKRNFRGYRCYLNSDPVPYLYNGCMYPYIIYTQSEAYKKTIRLETKLLHLFDKRDQFLYQSEKVNWTEQLNVHSGYEGKNLELDDIWQLNSSFGQVLRESYLEYFDMIQSNNRSFYNMNSSRRLCYTVENGENRPIRDLSFVQYLSVWSALYHAKVDAVEIQLVEGLGQHLRGPYWLSLCQTAVQLGISLWSVIRPSSSDLMGTSPIHRCTGMNGTFNQFFLGDNVRSIYSEWMDKPGYLLNIAEQHTPENSMHSVLALQTSVMINTTILSSAKKITLEWIRQTKTSLGRLFRLIYFNDTQRIHRTTKDVIWKLITLGVVSVICTFALFDHSEVNSILLGTTAPDSKEKVTLGTPAHFLFLEWQRSFKNNGLGNHLFWLASQIGIARQNQFIPVLPSYSPLIKMLANVSDAVKVVENKKYDHMLVNAQDVPEIQIYSKICCIYLPFTEHLNRRAEPSDVILRGAFQSFKYFHPKHEQYIKSTIKFTKETYQSARDYLDEMARLGSRKNAGSTVFIGIHIRRGDVSKTHLHHFGHQLAPKSYFDQARSYMGKKYGPHIVYVVTSNDLLWSKSAVTGSNVVYVDGTPEVSMNIMMLMDHLIISVGTFSWWCAYLSEAQEIVYYNGTPRVGSFYDVTFRAEDYWLPNWTGMSG